MSRETTRSILGGIMSLFATAVSVMLALFTTVFA
jgi:hypothetical protein